MDIAILLFEGITALDAVGPYEVLSKLPEAAVTFVAVETSSVRTDTGFLALTADATLDELEHPEILVVPGGPGQAALMDDQTILSWLRGADETSIWTTSVCTGSLLLGAAGILGGKRATTHWLALDQLVAFGATPASERVVFDGKVVTAAGVSAGIDMALAIAAEVAGTEVAQIIQLGIEYDPRPPFDAGSPRKAPTAVTEYLRSRSRFVLDGERR
jgi:transcriptional regulator GlxA family with amidase domain